MENKSVFGSIDQAWDLVKPKWKYFFGLTFIFGIVYIASSMVPALLGKAAGDFGFFIGYVVFIAFYALIAIGYIKIGFAAMAGGKPSYGELFSHLDKIFPVIGASILYALICLGGFILLIVPGVIWSIKYRYFIYFILEKNFGVMDSLKASSLVTKGYKGKLLIFSGFQAVIYYAGFFALLFGVFVAAPVAIIANQYLYRKLVAWYEEKHGEIKFAAPPKE